MKHAERQKAIETAVAAAVANPLTPAWAKVAIAALAEEVFELRAHLAALDGMVNALKREIDA